ncbi:M23 family metallopeptidase [Leptospira idonii]|uniref:M23ase beta-sheet core domain-containing protein n=1 Tax=Leptospira idonii TaxID=1193500 RepID=A0A4R9M6X4_9LEPT|nr:M23 family metallopeptidase [Leptospira idonii]TGN20408.1 hypothetical protein EHS15_04135 [Leptospira idonii]
MKQKISFNFAYLFFVLFFLPFSLFSAESIQDHWEKIEKKINAQDWEAAKPLIEKAVSEYPEEKIFRGLEIGILRNSGNVEESIGKARAAISKWPEENILKEELSYSLCSSFHSILKKTNFDRDSISKENHSIAKEAFSLKDSEWSTNLYGLSLRLQKRYEEAIQIFSEGYKRYPNEKHFQEQIGHIYLDQASDALDESQFQKAILLSEKSSRYLPNNEKANLIIALGWLQTDPEKALPYFTKAHEKEPDQKNYSQNLLYIYSQLVNRWIREKNFTKLSEAFPYIKKYSSLPGKQGIGFLSIWNQISNLDESFSELISFLKDKSQKYPDDIDLKVFYGSVLNKLSMKQRRNDPVLAEQMQQEANFFLRDGMKRFENSHPNRTSFLGIYFPLNGFVATASPFDAGGTHSGFEKYSYDFVHVDRYGSRLKPGTLGKNNSDYYSFGQTVYAVEDGVVFDLHDESNDNTRLGDIHFGDGNDIQIKHENGLFSFYVHLKHGSIKVTKGQKIKRGDPIAEVGNSGMSYEPHLHFTVVTADGISTYYEFEELKVHTGFQEIKTSQPYERGWVIEK